MSIEIVLFIFGLFIGSFLQVLAYRLPRGEGFITGRSRCDNCHHALGFFDLVPVFSFVFLQGKCRYCHKKLSWYYPLSEVTTGVLFVIVYTVVGISSIPFLLFTLFIVSCFIVIFSADLQTGIIPDKIVFSAFIITICFQYFFFLNSIISHLVSALGAGGFFIFLFVLTKGKGMGFGDVKLACLIGLLLGFPYTIYALYLAFLTGAFVSLILIMWRKKQFKSTIPFGPFLVVASLLVLLFPNITDKVISMVLP